MRFSTFFLAAGLTALMLAAPVFDHKQGEHTGDYDPWDECENEHTTYDSPAKEHSATTSPSVTLSRSLTLLSPALPTSTVPSSPVVSSSTAYSTAISTANGSVSSSEASSMPTTTTTPSEPAPSTDASYRTKATTTSSSSTLVASSTSSSSGTLQWLGVNESGAEFGSNIPGTLGTDYVWPDTASIQALMDKGMNIFRIPFRMERLAQGTMTASLDTVPVQGWRRSA